MFLEAAMLEPQTQVSGAVVIFDMDGLTLAQTTKFTPAFAKRIVDWLQVSSILIIILSKCEIILVYKNSLFSHKEAEFYKTKRI